MIDLTPDERAALERLRANAYDDYRDYQADGPSVIANFSTQKMLDSWACHAALLRLVPPDDETAIDEGWLKSVGFEPDDEIGGLFILSRDSYPLVFYPCCRPRNSTERNAMTTTNPDETCPRCGARSFDGLRAQFACGSRWWQTLAGPPKLFCQSKDCQLACLTKKLADVKAERDGLREKLAIANEGLADLIKTADFYQSFPSHTAHQRLKNCLTAAQKALATAALTTPTAEAGKET